MQTGYNSSSGAIQPAETVTVTVEEYLYFVQRAVAGMAVIVGELGDELSCTRPEIPGANTAYGLLTHCLGVMDYWAGHLVAGRPSDRNRATEFDATGTVAELAAHVGEALRQLDIDIAGVRSSEPLHREPDPAALGPARPLTQGAALLHLYEEVAQHHGQMQAMRDLLLNHPTDNDVDVQPTPSASVDVTDFEALPIEWLRRKRGVKWHRPGPTLIPAWVADMDFPLAEPIRTAIDAALDRGDLGYPDWDEHPLAEPFSDRMHTRYDWSPDPTLVRGITDIIQALQVVLTLQSNPGDGVIAFTPNYPPFLATIERMNRTLIPVPLLLSASANPAWTWDHDQLEATISLHGKAKVLLLVNPHNPTGKVFTATELAQIGELAQRHNLVVISDEIHAELTYTPAAHQPFAALDSGNATRTVTVTSATKAFNIAGLRTAVAHIGPAELRQAWDALPPDLLGATNVLGVEATMAAWAHGDAWLAALNTHLRAQRDNLAERIARSPSSSMHRPDAGYLGWLDFSAARLPGEPASWLRERAGVELSPGSDFGPGNEHRARLNFATSKRMLNSIVDRISDAVGEHSDRLGTMGE